MSDLSESSNVNVSTVIEILKIFIKETLLTDEEIDDLFSEYCDNERINVYFDKLCDIKYEKRKFVMSCLYERKMRQIKQQNCVHDYYKKIFPLVCVKKMCKKCDYSELCKKYDM